ncbi:MAG: mechanosensitive ion channel [Clostridia bacterium]|nr:mechanosensitive ion channel [Clostridia bacterium]
MNWEAILHNFVAGCVDVAIKLVISLVVFFVGRLLIKLVLKIFPDGKRFDHMDKTARNFLHNCIKSVLWIVLIITIVGIMGIEMASVITVLASAGAAIALALQGSLANFAGGVMVLLFRPFALGDFVDIGGKSGTVYDIGIFYTTLRTGDNLHIIIPNGQITTQTLTNYSREANRRVDIVFTVAYGTDVELVKKTILEVANAHEKVMQDPAPFVRMSEMADSSINFTTRVWVESDDFWAVKFDLLEQMNAAFAEKNIEIPFPQIEVHMNKPEQ